MRAVRVDLVASVVEPQDALRGVGDGYKIALAPAQRGERQAQEERHVLAAGYGVTVGIPRPCSSIEACYLQSRRAKGSRMFYDTDGSVASINCT